MNRQIKEHYKELFKKFGDSSKAVQYADAQSHFKRFEILTQIDPTMESVLDVGCGLAHLYSFLLQKNVNINYCGVDYVEEFIEHNKKKYQNHKNARFDCIDVIREELPLNYDYAIMNGAFNNKTDENLNFMYTCIKKMFEACNKGFAFNAMSTYVDYRDNQLFYIDPKQIFDYCKTQIGNKVVLRHDYLVKEDSIPFEFTIYVYK